MVYINLITNLGKYKILYKEKKNLRRDIFFEQLCSKKYSLYFINVMVY